MYEIYGPQEVMKILSDPGHWEKKCWIRMYNKKFLLPEEYVANDESTSKMGIKQSIPMNAAMRNQMSKRIASFNCYGLRSSMEMLPN